MQVTIRSCRQVAAGAVVCALALAGAASAVLTATPSAFASTSVGTEAALRTAFGDPNETHIDLTADITLSATCPDGVVGRTGTTPITVDGHGFTVTQTCTSGTSAVFSNPDGGALTFQNITITGGHSTGNGGGIFTQGGDVTLVNSTVENSTSESNGGGIAADVATVTLTNSTVSGNSSTSQNAGVGGGILANVVHATNSTVTGNTAPGSGGGIFAGEDTLVYSDVVGNTAPRGANLDVEFSDTLDSFGSVVALPAGGGGNCFFGTGESTNSHGYNWDDDGSCGFGAGPGDRSDAGAPALGALAQNGGDTETLLPQSGSGLIDAIPNGACTADGASGITTDQRGSARPSPAGGACDIGAVEVAAVPPSPPAPIAVAPTFTG